MRCVRFLIPLLFLAGAPLGAQELKLRPDPPPAPLWLGLRPLPGPFTGALQRASYELPGLGLEARRVGWAEAWHRRVRERLDAEYETLWRASRSTPLRQSRPAGRARTTDLTEADALLAALAGQRGELGLRVEGQTELGGAWNRYRPCDPTVHLTCNPSAFPELRPDVQLAIQMGGTISDRIHVDVDYDQRREFDAANNLNVYYRGLEGEVLRSVEMGDVSIRLPASRYLTQGVPSGNFGFKAEGQVGGLDFQALWAQQKGDLASRRFRLGGDAAPDGLVQDLSLDLDDADYAKGQFFFLVHPDSLAGAPHIDILGLRLGDAPMTLQPAAPAAIELYRDERPSFSNPAEQAQLGYFIADAEAGDGAVRHRGLFRRLVPGEDYRLHSSGLWVVLRSPLRPDEALAVSYVTETGARVGTPGAERTVPGVVPVLRLLRGPAAVHQPGQPTWPFEMRQVYRLDGSNRVDPSSVELEISLGERARGFTFKEVQGRTLTFLRLFGMDEEAPADQLDRARIFQPARGAFGELREDVRVTGTFIVFPTLQPFLEPPHVRSEGLSAEAAAAALAPDANPFIYESPDPVTRESSARFRLNFRYRSHTDGLASSFNLGAFGIREGSERITVDGRELRRDIDYTIDYELGLVSLTDPQAMLGLSPEAEIRAAWEQKALFQLAPTNVFGLNARYRAGTRGELNFVGFYQNERSALARPQLGAEPASIFLGGASGRFDLGAGWLDRTLARVPGLRVDGPSSLRLDGELAMSLPNPNNQGLTYLDDFEATDEIPLALERRFWRLGSRLTDPAGAHDLLPASLGVESAARLVWQHDFVHDGRVLGPLLAREIDSQINVAGAQLPEPVLHLTFGDNTDGGERRWRAITTVLSTTGRDMSRSEFLEFYVTGDGDYALIVDLGSVSNDAFYFDEAGETSGVYPDGRRWGLGVLDEEASLAHGEVWSREHDERGLWDQGCLAEPGRVYPLGDARANCTRGNGLVDTEDLDGGGVLQEDDGALFRYVVRLDGSSPYLVRDRDATGSAFRLYRIPLRAPGAIPVNGATDGTWRFIKHLRLTVTGSPTRRDQIALARLRIIGSRWAKRGEYGILRDLALDEPGLGAGRTRFRVGPVSRVTDGSVYSPPPGVTDRLQDPRGAFGGTGVEFNAKSLRLAYEDLEPGDRAEVYYRYPQQPRNLLSYREIRLWALPRSGRWGEDGDQWLTVRVGTDAGNYYLYRTPLNAPADGDAVRPEDWLPERVIDFERWFALKAEAEQALVEQGVPAGQPLVLWSADSTYAIVLRDRARAPNLAAVRELAFAVHNAGASAADGEVWIDEMRLGGPVREAGFAGHLELDLRGGDVLSAHVGYSGKGALFRQLDEAAGYHRSGELSVRTTADLGRLAPEAWGLDAPVTVSHSRTTHDPMFLDRTDIPADRLPGLRDTGAQRTRVGLTLRRSTASENPWVAMLLDGTALRFGYHNSSNTAAAAALESRGFDGGISYSLRPAARELRLLPAAVERLLRWLLPAALEEADAFQRLTSARLRWNPADISLGSTYHDTEHRSFRYEQILATAADGEVRPIESARRGLEQNVRVGFRPLHSLTADLTVLSSRDLLAPERAAAHEPQRAALVDARRRLAGLDLGWESYRSIGTRVGYRPVVASWLRPGFSYSARYRSDRNASDLELLTQGDDTTAVLQRSFRGERQVSRTLLLEPEGLMRSLFGDGEDGDAPDRARVARLVGRTVLPVDLSWNRTLGSSYDRETFSPGLGYQLGLGGFDRFRFLAGDTAASALERGAFRARSGLRLPGAAELHVGYGRADLDVIDRRGGSRQDRETNWPQLRLAWNRVPLPHALRAVVTRATVSVGFQRTDRDALIGTGADQLRGREERSIPVQLAVGLGNGLSAFYNATFTDGAGHDPTGSSEQRTASHAFQLAGTFRPPGPLGESLAHPVQTSLRFTSFAQRHCRVRPTATATEVCTAYVDLINQSLDLNLETVLSDMNVGLQVSYTDRRSFVGTGIGSRQFRLNLYGRFNVSAGTFPGGMP